ncbi:hypothetical protein Y032_0514g2769 [Ancylostoma ceylanicum]|uniref:Uncharacterized protein n=1 Tax=Ancylostoma ceylanicum TaxID=53326 RepID=A0A016WSR2_9BILA|nr:hypothetical protein Y032_0514g2769 [Ancylostoma ceylanicum]
MGLIKGSAHGKIRSEHFDSFEKPLDLGSSFAVQAALQVSLYLSEIRSPRTRWTCFSADCTYAFSRLHSLALEHRNLFGARRGLSTDLLAKPAFLKRIALLSPGNYSVLTNFQFYSVFDKCNCFALVLYSYYG